MKYIQACGLEEHEVYFFEVDGQMAAYRQVSVVNGHCRVSVAPDFHLIETEVELFEGDEEITREAFEGIWQQAVLPYREAWEKAKSLCPPGKNVAGTIRMFYPQGVIIQLDEGAYAVADDPGLRERTPPAWMYPGYRIQGKVERADEALLMLVLKDCRVTGKKVEEMHL
ncbi:hypothetical protein NYE48_16075 [Paenibacillus sp. FSL M7-1455]|uniref:hypothetical protein n=1 Tax=Paenibacillus sp. FSL M7-1455 TaxID=2975316 RepID=UPI0030FA54B6